MDFLAKNLAYLVASNGGQAAVAKRAGKDQTTISRIIAGKVRDTSYRTVAEAAKQFGVSIDALVNVDLESSPAEQSQSQPLQLDPVILAESIAALRQVARRRGWAYDPEVHAESTCYAYELWQMLPSTRSTADVIDIGERIAERLRRDVERQDGEQGAGAGTGAVDRGGAGPARAGKARAAGGTQ